MNWREGRRLVRFKFGRRSSLFCVPVFFLYLCLLWVSVFFGFYVGPAKLQRGATPPSVMVLFLHVFSLLSVIVQHLLTIWDCSFPVMFSMSKIDLKFILVSERMWILVGRKKSF